jgi:hypothetical protein
MLSTAYRLRLESIASKIVRSEQVELSDMIWADKLAHANMSAARILRQARRKAANPDMKEGGLDDFLNQLDLGEPDPRDHRTKFNSVDDLADWFSRDNPEDWRRRD